MKNKKYRGIENIKSRYGMMFVTPWAIGFIVFFLVPVIQSVLYSFSDVTLTTAGVSLKFVGWESYKYYLAEDPDFTNYLVTDFTSLLYSLPIIILVSVVLALLLNQNLRGRLFFRALYFMPVIIASGVVIEMLFKTTDRDLISSGVNVALTDSMFSIEDVISWLNMPDKIAGYVKTIINNIFDLLWNCGIQTVLFIAGLQSIPRSLYEASNVEGATKWEEFWFITFPMLGNVTMLVALYTMVDFFTASRRRIINVAFTQMNSGIYDTTSTMLWIYFVVIGVAMGLLLLIYNRTLLRRWQ
jgi:ABC-type sugar transport system permease subunit